jgi:hypothetical protein
MAPQAKESVLLHLPSYAAGMAYHLGIFTAFALLAVKATGLQFPGWGSAIGGFLALAGTCGGLALLSPAAGVCPTPTTSFQPLATASPDWRLAAWIPSCEVPWMLAGSSSWSTRRSTECLFFFPTASTSAPSGRRVQAAPC